MRRLFFFHNIVLVSDCEDENLMKALLLLLLLLVIIFSHYQRMRSCTSCNNFPNNHSTLSLSPPMIHNFYHPLLPSYCHSFHPHISQPSVVIHTNFQFFSLLVFVSLTVLSVNPFVDIILLALETVNLRRKGRKTLTQHKHFSQFSPAFTHKTETKFSIKASAE